MIAKGTYGDMFPMYAIAKSLKKRGYELTIATNAANVDAVLSLGFHVLRIDKPDRVILRNGFDKFLYKIAGNSWFIKTFLLSSIETEYEILLQAAEEYDLLIGNQLAYTGSMVKEKPRI